jgi:hypothetical protein
MTTRDGRVQLLAWIAATCADLAAMRSRCLRSANINPHDDAMPPAATRASMCVDQHPIPNRLHRRAVLVAARHTGLPYATTTTSVARQHEHIDTSEWVVGEISPGLLAMI